MKSPYFRLLLLSIIAVNGCKSKKDPTPDPVALITTEPFDSESDILSRSHGYWEWLRSFSVNGTITPTSVGFTRQLVFKGDGRVYINHNQQFAIQRAYVLSTSVPTRCGAQSPQSLIKYGAEPQIKNDSLRLYRVAKSLTDTTLSIIGETACVDGGMYESYRWHRRR